MQLAFHMYAPGAVGDFSFPGSAFCALISLPVPPPCYAQVARKRSRSFCQKCRWQVTAKHTCTPTHEVDVTIMHGYMVYTERAETAAVSRGTSHLTTKKSCKYTTSVDLFFFFFFFFFFFNAIKRYSHSFRNNIRQ